MNRRTLFILAGVFFLLIVATVLQNTGVRLPFGQPTPTPTTVQFPPVFDDIVPGNIEAMRIGTLDGETSLLISRASDGSWAAPDLDTPLDQEQTQLIARTLAIMPYAQTIPITDDLELTSYGFTADNPDALSIEILVLGGQTHGMIIGGMAPNGVANYAIADDREEIYLIEPRAVAFLRLQLRNPPIRLTTE